MRVLVTGANGFIGREIVSELSKKNIEVIEIRGTKTQNSEKATNNANVFNLNITDKDEVKSLKSLKKVEVIIHCAGLAHQFGNTEKADFFSVNVDGTENICKLANEIGARHLILISSVAVYGKQISNPQGIDESFECQPIGFYAESKFEAENIARKICENNFITLTILRPSTVIGEGDRGNVGRLVKLIDKKRFFWIGQGENFKSLIYKKDVALACLAVLKQKTTGTEVYNVSAKPLTMKEIVTLIAKNLNKKVPEIYIPEQILKYLLRRIYRISGMKKMHNLLETVEKWTGEDIFISNKIKEVYDFTPKTSVSEAIALEVKWYKDKKCLK